MNKGNFHEISILGRVSVCQSSRHNSGEARVKVPVEHLCTHSLLRRTGVGLEAVGSCRRQSRGRAPIGPAEEPLQVVSGSPGDSPNKLRPFKKVIFCLSQLKWILLYATKSILAVQIKMSFLPIILTIIVAELIIC